MRSSDHNELFNSNHENTLGLDDLAFSGNSSRYENIRSYGYTECGNVSEMNIFDFENIKSPERYSSSCNIDINCNNCIKHIKICEIYKKKYLALKKQNNILKTRYVNARKLLINLRNRTRGKYIPRKKIQSQYL